MSNVFDISQLKAKKADIQDSKTEYVKRDKFTIQIRTLKKMDYRKITRNVDEIDIYMKAHPDTKSVEITGAVVAKVKEKIKYYETKVLLTEQELAKSNIDLAVEKKVEIRKVLAEFITTNTFSYDINLGTTDIGTTYDYFQPYNPTKPAKGWTVTDNRYQDNAVQGIQGTAGFGFQSIGGQIKTEVIKPTFLDGGTIA